MGNNQDKYRECKLYLNDKIDTNVKGIKIYDAPIDKNNIYCSIDSLVKKNNADLSIVREDITVDKTYNTKFIDGYGGKDGVVIKFILSRNKYIYDGIECRCNFKGYVPFAFKQDRLEYNRLLKDRIIKLKNILEKYFSKDHYIVLI
jgi:hypothetical protein